MIGQARVSHTTVRLKIVVGDEIIKNVGKYESCVVSKLPIIFKRTRMCVCMCVCMYVRTYVRTERRYLKRRVVQLMKRISHSCAHTWNRSKFDGVKVSVAALQRVLQGRFLS